jgi:hypothetical protein
MKQNSTKQYSLKQFRRLTAGAASVVLILVLGACSMVAPDHGSTKTQQTNSAPDPSPSPTAIAEDPGLAVTPGDELMTITATAQTDYGAKLDITLIVHLPVEWDSSAGERMLNYLESRHVNSSMVDTRWDQENNISLGVVDVRVVASGEVWLDGSEVQLALGPRIAKDVVFSVPGRDVNGRFTISGEGVGHAIVAFPAFDGRPDAAAWAEAVQTWGMSPAVGPGDKSELMPSLHNCSVSLTELAKFSSWVTNWSPPQGDSCATGIDH